MFWNFPKFLLEEYSTFFKYWQISIVIFLIVVMTSLQNCSNLLKFLVFFIKTGLIVCYLLGLNLILYYNHVKKILSSTACLKTNSKIFDLITIIIIFGFALIIFFLSLTDSIDTSILGFKINLELKIIIACLGLLSLLVTYICGYLLTQIQKLYSSLTKVSNKYKHIIDPSQNTTLIGWGVLLVVILVWFGITDMFTDSADILKYTIKSLVCIGALFLYFSYLICYNLSFIQKNYYDIVNKK